MSEKRELFATVKEFTSGIPAAFVAAFGSALTSLIHSLQTEELLYANMVALGTVCFVVFRMVLMGIDMWIKTQSADHEKALEEIADKTEELDQQQREMGDQLKDLSEELQGANLAEAIRKNQIKLEKEISPNLPDRLKKTDGEL